jgi:hypothetical protein
MTKPGPFRCFKTSPEIIRLAAMLYVRFPLSLRNRAAALTEWRGIRGSVAVQVETGSNSSDGVDGSTRTVSHCAMLVL